MGYPKKPQLSRGCCSFLYDSQNLGGVDGGWSCGKDTCSLDPKSSSASSQPWRPAALAERGRRWGYLHWRRLWITQYG